MRCLVLFFFPLTSDDKYRFSKDCNPWLLLLLTSTCSPANSHHVRRCFVQNHKSKRNYYSPLLLRLKKQPKTQSATTMTTKTTTTTTTTTKSNKKANYKKTNQKKKSNEKAAIHLVGDEPIVDPSFVSINSCRLMLADAACHHPVLKFKKILKNSFSILVQNSDISPLHPEILIRSPLLTAQGFQLIDG
jgi:hypothetical protein